ncbi:proteoglycan 4-like isoform X3 [Eriocheir sinensis]|uniref:proteoglycan 4-like isoform X3 n=1 Tax=Eriocheir sinensis TaxID=95602 RepID=UPI0021C79A1A|nr:proteoglycan 4-like isoform X3 [Eriocheir sinensis]
MKDLKSSLASKDKTFREFLKSASSPRTLPDGAHTPSVGNGNANDQDYLGSDGEQLKELSATPPAGDGAMQTPEAAAAEAPPPMRSVGSLVEYLMSGPGRKAAKRLKEVDGSGMVQAPVVHQITTAGSHTPPPRIATPPPEVPVQEEETFVPEVSQTMAEVVQLAVQNKDKVKVAKDDGETQDATHLEQHDAVKPPAQAEPEHKDETPATVSYTSDAEKNQTLSDAIKDSIRHTETPNPASAPTTTSRPSSSDRTATSSRPPSSGGSATPRRSDSKEEVTSSSRPSSKDRPKNPSRPASRDRATDSSRPSSKDRAMSSSRPASKDKTVSFSRPTSKDRGVASKRPPSKESANGSSRPNSRDRSISSSRPPSKDRAMGSSRPTSRERGKPPSRPSSRERGSRSGASSRPTSRERPSNAKTDTKSILTAVDEDKEAATRTSRSTTRGKETTESSKIPPKESVKKPSKADNGPPAASTQKSSRTRSGAESPWTKLAASQESNKPNQQKNVEKLYQRLIKKHVSGNTTTAAQDAAGHKTDSTGGHAAKYRVLSQTPDLRDGSPLVPTTTRGEESPQQNDALLVGVPHSLKSSSSRPNTPKQDSPSSLDTTAAAAQQDGHAKKPDSRQPPVQEIQPSRSLLASMAEHNFQNARNQTPSLIQPTGEAPKEANSQDDQVASKSHPQDIKPKPDEDGANQSTEQVAEKSGSQPGGGKESPTDQSITENGVASSTTSVKDSGGKVPELASGPSRVAPSGGSENNAAGSTGEASPITQGDAAVSGSVTQVIPQEPLKPFPYSDHVAAPTHGIHDGGFPRAPEPPASYAPRLRGDVLVKALEESARTNAGGRLHLPPHTGQSAMPYHMSPRGTSMSAVEVPEPTLATVSLAVSKGANEVGRPAPLRNQGGGGGLFNRLTSNSSSTSLWHKITPLAVRPSNDYYREPREYEDYLPREPPRPVLQRRNSLGRINARDYADDDYYYDDDYNESSRHTKEKESRGAQTVRVKNQQPRHGILKKTETRQVRKEEPRNTILEKLEEYRNSPPIIIASGIVPKNLESLTSEYQATRGKGGGGNDSQRNGTKNHKEKEHFQDRNGETGVTAPLLATSGHKQTIGDVFDRLHNNRRLEHAALVSRKPELKQKPKPIPAKSKEKDAGVTNVTPRGTVTEPQRHHLQNGGKDVYTRLYQNAAPPRKRRDEYGETTRLLDNAANTAAPAVAFRHEGQKTSPRASKDVQKLQTRADHVINMPMLAPDIVVDDEPAAVHPGHVEQTGKGGNDKIPIVLLQGFFQGPGVRSPHHRRPSMSVNELTLPPHLVDVTSVIRGALPVLPRSLAALCLTLNILLPGLGTAASGWLGLCWGRNRMGTVETSGHRFTSVVVTAATGLVQLFTVTFFLVGWFWGVAWGILLVSIANKYTQFVSEHRSSISGAVSLEMLAVNAS